MQGVPEDIHREFAIKDPSKSDIYVILLDHACARVCIGHMSKEMMSAEDVAEFLNLNVKKVYQLAGEGLIPAARVGGKWLFPKTVLEEWIQESARQNLKHAPAPDKSVLVIIGSNDLVWETISRELIKTPYHLITPYASVGSMEGLSALGRRKAHIAGVHLLDPLTGEYNIPYLSPYLAGHDVLVVNLFYRNQGLIIQKGNPKNIQGITDLIRSDVTMINRQEGSGTRVLLDYLLDKNGISRSSINGYLRSVSTHIEIALEIKKGAADTGPGIMAAAHSANIDFIALQDERYDIVIPKEHTNLKSVQTLLNVIRSNQFHMLVGSLNGYDLRDSGKIMWEGTVH